jgi:hypothetical protein
MKEIKIFSGQFVERIQCSKSVTSFPNIGGRNDPHTSGFCSVITKLIALDLHINKVLWRGAKKWDYMTSIASQQLAIPR